MSYSFHGNYCGPGWTAGKYLDAKDATEADFLVPAVDQLDAICKKHDMAIWRAYRVKQKSKREILLKIADKTFVREIKNANIPGPKDDVAGFCVWAAGPSKKLRVVEDDEDMDIGETFVEAISDGGGTVDDPPRKKRKFIEVTANADGTSEFITPEKQGTRQAPTMSASNRDRIRHGLPARRPLTYENGKSFVNLRDTTQWSDDFLVM